MTDLLPVIGGVAVRRGCSDRLSSEGGVSVMDRKTLVIILVVLAVIAVGVWAWRLRSTYPKEYTGEQPSGVGAPMKMDRPMGVGQPGGVQQPQPQQPQQQPQAGVGAF